jgi:membrane complex biogenesis BtpA family protein
MTSVVERALRDADALDRAGLDALLVENYGDAPFPRGRAAPETVAAMAILVEEVAKASSLPVGVNILRNDAISALAVAAATGASFLRVNVLGWARLTDQGVVEGEADELLRKRAALGAERVLLLADVAVKHSAPLAAVSLEQEAQDLVERALADALVVTGPVTGGPVDLGEIRRVREAVYAPVLAGSGVTEATAPEVKACSAGAIVGSALMRGGKPGGPVSLDRASRLVAAWRNGPG